MEPSRTIVSLERFWASTGTSYELTTSGWLAEPSRGKFFSVNPTITVTQDLAVSRCLVLLGEPGMGKTSAIDSGRALLPNPDVPLRHFDLGSFGSEERLVSRVFEDPHVVAWSQTNEDLCLSLDGFDEAHNRIETLPRILIDFLTACDSSRLYLRIACRTANWPVALRQILEDQFGVNDVQVQELLPLRRGDAAALLQAAGVEPTDVLAAAEAARVVPLASRPLTLKLIRASAEVAGELPPSASELYRRGLLALADEVDPVRRGTALAAGSAVERIAVASRIAAISILGGQPSIWIGQVALADDSAITLDDCLPTLFEP